MTSCENFLKAAEIKDQIEEAIAIANTNPVTYYVIADNESGTVNPSQLRLKKKESFDVMFIPANGWEFICWEVLDRDTLEVVDDVIKFENPTKLETKGTVLNPKENLMIHPKCSLAPKVKSFEPVSVPSGCRQDESIIITFNKPMDPESFGDFSCISIVNEEGKRLFSTIQTETYFEQPQFSQDNTVLTIHTAKGKFILDDNTTRQLDKITITIDYTYVKDCDGFSAEQNQTYSYYINRQTDNVAPVLTSLNVYSTSDTSDYFYKELTDKPESQWSDATILNDNGTPKYQNGDYSRNHVSKLYFTLEGYDNDSGIKSVVVEETFKAGTNGVAVTNSTPKTKEVPAIRLNDSNLYAADYQFNAESQIDGLYHLKIWINDYSRNNSEKYYEYWVIKDTYNGFGGGNFQIRTYFPKGRNANTVLPVYNAQKGIYEAKIGPTGSNAENNTSGVFHDFLAFADKYYSNYESHRFAKFDVYYEDNPENIFLSLSADLGNKSDITSIVNSLFNDFMRDVDKTTIIKITMTEESGAFSTFNLPIPKRLNVGGVYAPNSNSNARYIKIPEYNYKPLGYNLSYLVLYTVGDGLELKGEGITQPTIIKLEDNQNVYNAYVVAYLDNSEFGNACYVYSALGDSYIFDINTNTTLTSPTFDLPDEEDVKYEPNTGVAEFNIDIGEHSENYRVYVNIVDPRGYGYGHYTFSEGSIIGVPSNYDYNVFLTMVDAQGNYIGQTDSKPISLKRENNSKPYMFRQAGGTVYNRPHGFIDSESMVFGDFPRTSGNTKILNFDYYIIPATYTGNKFDKAFLESISSYKRTAHLTQSDVDRGNYNLYVGDSDGQFKVIYYVEDEYKNYVIQGIESSFKHFISEYKPEVNYNSSTSKITVSAVSYSPDLCTSPEVPTVEEFNNLPESVTSDSDFMGSDIYNKVSIKYLEDNVWKQRSVTVGTSTTYPETNADMTKNDSDNNWTYGVDYSNYSNQFLKITGKFNSGYKRRAGAKGQIAYLRHLIFMKPVYVYSGYLSNKSSYVCNTKGWAELLNGYIIYADKPSFVHIRCCPKLLTTGKTQADIDKWEARGMELGIVYNDGSNGNYTYSDTNFEEVPSGWYYTTIVHFADGSAIMSDVKQKQ